MNWKLYVVIASNKKIMTLTIIRSDVVANAPSPHVLPLVNIHFGSSVVI